jgi:hypothetical protein
VDLIKATCIWFDFIFVQRKLLSEDNHLLTAVDKEDVELCKCQPCFYINPNLNLSSINESEDL